MRPGPSAFVRPDCAEKCGTPKMHGGPCGSCAMGTNPGRTHRFYTGKPVTPFGYGLSCEATTCLARLRSWRSQLRGSSGCKRPIAHAKPYPCDGHEI